MLRSGKKNDRRRCLVDLKEAAKPAPGKRAAGGRGAKRVYSFATTWRRSYAYSRFFELNCNTAQELPIVLSSYKNPVRITTGVKGLNDILHGGLPSGQMYLLEGDPGTGKSTIALQFASAAVERGDKASVYVFDEVLRTTLDRAESLGMPVRSQIESGLLEISQIDPAELAPGELIDSIRKDVEE